MPGSRWQLLPVRLLLIILILVGAQATKAETAYTAALSAPDTSDFPYLTAYLDVHDPEGAFVHGLKPQDVSLLENDLQIPVSVLEEQKPGVQFVIAITPGESFSIRDGLGVSRYEYLLQDLLAGTWVNQGSGLDDFSLLTLGGPQLIHTSDPNALRSALEEYLPDGTSTTPNLEVLASALQVASDPPRLPGTERAILFITPPQNKDVSLGLQSIITSANQQNIHVFVWMVSSQDVFDTPEAELLRNMANQTRASFFAFSSDEPVPDLESLLEPLRYIYQLGYTSQITTTGTQNVVAQVNVGSEQIATEPQSFELDLQSPAPILLNPPDEIIRTFQNQSTPGIPDADADLVPTEQAINIRVTFPDGYDRPLTRTSLYIDDTLYSENTSPPYDKFIWDIQPYTQDGTHILKVSAIDSMGMLGTSGDSTVRIIVPRRAQGIMVAFSQNKPLLVGIIAFISVFLIILGLILGGRIRPKPHPGQVKVGVDSTQKTRPVVHRQGINPATVPVTQRVNRNSMPVLKSTVTLKGRKKWLPWIKQKEEPVPALAYLVPLKGTDEPTLPAPLPIVAEDTSIGRDPLQAVVVINNPSIENLHARIHREGSSFLITDAGSVAGTWVNFNLVPPSGIQLEHADIIHIGQVGFRFKLTSPEHLRTVVVTPLDDEH